MRIDDWERRKAKIYSAVWVGDYFALHQVLAGLDANTDDYGAAVQLVVNEWVWRCASVNQ
jgi:hypothetical protein